MDGAKEEVVTVDTVAEDKRGVPADFTATTGIGLVFRRPCSFTSSTAHHSSFSALVRSESFFPRKSTDSALRCASISSAALVAFFASVVGFEASKGLVA